MQFLYAICTGISSPFTVPCYMCVGIKKHPLPFPTESVGWGAVLDSFVVLFPGQEVGRVVAVVVVAELLAHCSFGHNFAC